MEAVQKEARVRRVWIYLILAVIAIFLLVRLLADRINESVFMVGAVAFIAIGLSVALFAALRERNRR
ncbi:hypothetical protein ACFY3U_10680 [Micromonospora sp. NPDC000089]|uniref:hypothetical protein n=1 Tax=unclassified Micromonospora TaxID=2617518 RepID=UPI0036D0F4AE